jgi:dTDP-glucose pyrophosphorylase
MSVIEAMATIDKGAKRIAFVCENDVMQSTLSDGDIRRYILKNGDLNARVAEIGNKSFLYGKLSDSQNHLEQLCKKMVLSCIPILAEDGRLVDVYLPNEAEQKKTNLNIPVVIMAGGKGVRLHPYTKILPKPLIPIGDLTITDHIISSFIDYGCIDFTMIINHKKNMIKAYFADSDDISFNIAFMEEEKPLGTGGGLGLLRGKLCETFFMTNCDIIIFEDYAKILDRHKAAKNVITMVCATKRISVPYGAVDIDQEGQVNSIIEKPSYSILANTGFYVIEQEFLDIIPDDKPCHITDLIHSCMECGKKVGIYPVSEEQWADMGQPEEMERMLSMLEKTNRQSKKS